MSWRGSEWRQLHDLDVVQSASFTAKAKKNQLCHNGKLDALFSRILT